MNNISNKNSYGMKSGLRISSLPKIAPIALVLISLLAVSCKDKIDVDLQSLSQRLIVVEGMITDQPGPHYIKLSYSADYFYNQETPRVTGADVRISWADTSIQLTEVDTVPGLYQTTQEFAGQAGETYSLSVMDVFGQRVTASCYLASVSPIDSVNIDYYVEPFSGDKYYRVNLNAQEPAGKGDNYFFSVYVNDTLVSDTVYNQTAVVDDYYDGEYLADFSVFYFEAERVKTDTFSVRTEMYSAPRAYIDFIYGVQNITIYSGTIFSVTPANPRTNLSEGGWGFFLASAVNSYTTEGVLRRK